MRPNHLAVFFVALSFLLLAQPAYALKGAGEECASGNECSSGYCALQEASCGKKVVNNSITLAATGKRLEDCQPVRATCAGSPAPCRAHLVNGAIRYECDK